MSTSTESIETALDSLQERGVALIVHEPGNGSRYVVVISDVDRCMSGIPNYTPAQVVGGHFLVSLPDFQTCYPFALLSGGFAGEYVGEKLFRGNRADGAVIADLLNRISAALGATR